MPAATAYERLNAYTEELGWLDAGNSRPISLSTVQAVDRELVIEFVVPPNLSIRDLTSWLVP